ncbi:sugar isomerase, partial [Mesorhizobium sp. M7A.F.Ca.US.005.03.2.1]
MEHIISAGLVDKDNAARKANLERDYASLGERLDRRGIAIDAVRDKVEKFAVAIPSWGVGTGGTRFARFPGAGEPRDIFDKIEDCAVIQQLTQATPTVSLHIPWDKADPNRLKQAASRFGLGFDAMNSNTFSDAKDQKLSYKFGSLSHADAGTRRQAVEHNLECIEIGKTLGSKALTVWIGDGSNFPGQVNFAKAFERYLDAMKE